MTEEEKQKEWEELKKYNEVGPTVEDYCERVEANILNNSKSLDPEISKIVDENFWDLINTDKKEK